MNVSIGAVLLLSSLLANVEAARDNASAPRLDADILLIEPVGRYGRAAVHIDAIQARMARGQWTAPRAGDSIELHDGSSRTWTEARLNNDNSIAHAALRGGYLFATVHADEPRIVLLEAAGHSMVYVNGEPRGGDLYHYGWVSLPIALESGKNELLFHSARGRMRISIAEPRSDAFFDLRDATLPDIVREEGAPNGDDSLIAGLLIVNASRNELRDAGVHITGPSGEQRSTTVGTIPPLTVRKVPVNFAPELPEDSASQAEYRIVLIDRYQERVLDEADLALRVRNPDQTYRRTFISDIDGSVQYYAVRRAAGEHDEENPNAIVLSLHGASVEATSQADAYTTKDWAHIIAPTNRRPFGFDWEDWGRLDALEVLDHAMTTYSTDPSRTYLTGHSMGGHGTWHLGVTFPDRFAAIAPSAGWISFWSYTGAARYERDDPIESLLARATSPSDTLALTDNLRGLGVYILHGDADDNVPVEQARIMREHLSSFHADFAYYERPGAGHWWGNACVDWPPIFEFFKARSIPEMQSTNRIDFVTASPSVSSSAWWASIESQRRAMMPSSVRVEMSESDRTITGTTENVQRISFDLSVFEGSDPIRIALDDQNPIEITPRSGIHTSEGAHLTRDSEDQWTATAPNPDLKSPRRYGPIKDAFRNNMLLIYSTRGDDEENAWSYNKARFDAETFWYRGNGGIEIIADRDFSPEAHPDRNIILYGSADTNSAWHAVLDSSPITITRGRILVGDRLFEGDDLGSLFIHPRAGSDTASVAVIAGTGLPGMRALDRLPYFVSGVAYPDWVIFSTDILEHGIAGIRGAGYFGEDWSLERGEAAWRE